MSVMMQKVSCIVVDTTISRTGCFCAEGVCRKINHDLRKPTNTVALGRVRKDSKKIKKLNGAFLELVHAARIGAQATKYCPLL